MKVLLQILLCCYSTSCFSQKFEQKFFNVKDGLPHSCIFRIEPDPTNHFLWIGTDHGISRFDGREFENFTFDQQVASNYILSIYPLAPDSFLISFYRDGLFLFSNGTLMPFNPGNAQSSKDRPKSLDKRQFPEKLDLVVEIIKVESEFWFINNYRLFKIPNGGNTFHCVPIKDEPLDSQDVLCFQKKNKTLWVGTTRGLYVIDSLGNQTVVWNKGRVSDILMAPIDPSLVATDQGIYSIDDDLNIARRTETKDFDVRLLYMDNGNRLWFSTLNKGLFVLKEGLATLVSLDGLERPMVNDIQEDCDGNIWLATMANGLCRLSSPTGLSRAAVLGPKPNFIKTVTSTKDGTIWAGAYGQIYSSTSGDEFVSKAFPLPKNELVRAFYWNDSLHKVLVAAGAKLLVFNNGEYESTMDLLEPVVCFEKRQEGGIWMGTRDGLYWLHHIDSHPVQIIPLNYSLTSTRINYLLEDHKSRLWMATDEGLLKLEKGKVSTLEYPIPERIEHIFQASTGEIYFSTTNGAMKWDKEQWQVYKRSTTQQSSTSKEPISNHCVGFGEDERHTIWLVTDLGIVKVQKDQTLVNYDISSLIDIDGITNMCMLPGNELLLATLNRIIKVDLETLRPSITPPQPYFKSITSNGLHLDTSKRIQLPYSQNNLRIEFSNICFHDHAQTISYYRMGHDTQWRRTLGQVVSYEALAPGNYQFELKAGYKNNAGTSHPILFSFSIDTPIWMRSWFIISLSVFIIGLLFLFYRIRTNALRRVNQQKLNRQAELAKLKHKALNAMMNPHFITNSLHAITQMSRTENPVERDVEKYASHFSKLVRINLEQSENANVPLSLELEQLKRYLTMEQSRLKHGFDFDFDVDTEVDAEIIEVPNMFLQPLMENAIWHGFAEKKQGGHLYLNITFTAENTMRFVIEDNGLGYNSDWESFNHKPSYGLQIVKEKLLLHNPQNTFLIEPLPKSDIFDGGTRVTIQLHID